MRCVASRQKSYAGPVTDWWAILEHCDEFVAFGGIASKNWQIQSGGAGLHPFEDFMSEAARRGIRFTNISPLRSDRARVRAMQADGDFIEAWCKCPLEVCEQRDVKGLYRRARAGEVRQFTGVSAPYEVPLAPELSLDTARAGLADCVELVLAELRSRGVLRPSGSSSSSSSRQMRAAWSPSSSSECHADTDTASSG